MATSEDEFSCYISTVTRHTVIGHGLDVGKKTGLLKVMIELVNPMTSVEIASTANMKERYVREWLNLMVCGKIIDYEKTSKTYYLPDEKKEVFKPNSKSNLHMFASVLNFFSAQKEVEECFKLDGPPGVPMSAYNFAFHHHSHDDSTMSYEKVHAILSQFPAIISRLDEGAKIFEGGCGSGILATRLAVGFKNSKIHGLDVSEEAIEKAISKANEQKLKNATFEVGDLSNMSQIKSKDYDFVVTHFVIHDVPKATAALNEIRRILKPGGCYLMVDVNMHSDVGDNLDYPEAVFAYGASLMFAMPVTLVDGGEGLGPTWGIEKMQEYLEAAGFEKVHLPCEPNGRNAYVIGFNPSQ